MYLYSIFDCTLEDIPRIHDCRIIPHIQHIEILFLIEDGDSLFTNL